MHNIFELQLGGYCLHSSFVSGTAAFVGAHGAIGLVHSGEASIRQVCEGVTSAASTPLASWVLVGSEDGTILKIHPEHIEKIVEPTGKWITSLACGVDGTLAYAVGRRICIIDPSGEVRTIDSDIPIENLSFSTDGAKLAAAGLNSVNIYATRSATKKRQLSWPGLHRLVAFSPDGRFILTAMQPPSLHAWQLAEEQQIEMIGYTGKIRDFSWSADGRWLATSGGPGSILWSFVRDAGPTGSVPSLVGYRPNSVATAVACHPAESLVATGFDDGLVAVIYTLEDKVVVLRPPGHSSIVSISWNVAGDGLAFGDELGYCGVIGFN